MAGADYTGWILKRVRPIPPYLVSVYAFLLISNIFILFPISGSAVFRALCSFLLLLFVPGFVSTLVIFPESRSAESAAALGDGTGRPRGLDGTERAVVSVGLSIVIVMSTALFLHLSGLGITLRTSLTTVNAFVIVTTAAGIYRQLRIPEARRVRPQPRRWARTLRAELASFHGVDRLLLVSMGVLILLVAVGGAFTVLNPGPDDRYTELYLLHENETGAAVATDYPTELTAGEPTSLIVGINNHEFETTTYTVVVELQRTAKKEPDSPIREEREVARFQATLDHDERWRRQHEITADMTGEDLRIMYLLYRGDPPPNPTRADAYRTVYLWVDITADASGPSQDIQTEQTKLDSIHQAV